MPAQAEPSGVQPPVAETMFEASSAWSSGASTVVNGPFGGRAGPPSAPHAQLAALTKRAELFDRDAEGLGELGQDV